MGVIKVKNAIFVLAAAACAATIGGASVYASELPTHIMNGSFEKPAIDSTTQGNETSGSKTGAYFLTTSDKFEELSNNEFYWKTTAANGLIEIVSRNKASIKEYNVSAPKEGDQFAELVADEQSSLYQTISTEKTGTVLNWGLSHAGRKSQDTMALFIGAPQDSLTKKTKDGKDIFMWMAELITSQYSSTDMAVGCTEYTIYSQSNIDLSAVTSSNYTQFFSFTQTTDINQKWKCWIITDKQGEWGTYNGKYSVPENQPETVFAFTAITGSNNQSADGNMNEGNLLDEITFGISYPLTVSSTYGGEGVIDISGNDSVTVAAESSYTNTYTAGTEATITAKATNESYALLGYYINNIFYSDISQFTKNDDGSYSRKFTLSQPTNIRIVFGSTSAVIYSPNGGTYNGKTESTSITMFANEDVSTEQYAKWKNTQDAVPADTDSHFVGWYLASRERNRTSVGGGYSSC